MYEDSTAKMAAMITERLPSPNILQLLLSHRAHGVQWEDIEDRVIDVAPELADAGMPMSAEAAQYTRRVLIAARALECGGMNN